MSATAPTCYAVVRDAKTRQKISESLASLGWSIVEPPTGLDLIHELSGHILGDRPGRPVDLVVIEEAAPGCRGSTIARGLRELGISVPVALIANTPASGPELPVPPEDPDQRVFVLDPPLAPLGVAAIARHRHPGTNLAA
jgi:hypothetical protein